MDAPLLRRIQRNAAGWDDWDWAGSLGMALWHYEGKFFEANDMICKRNQHARESMSPLTRVLNGKSVVQSTLLTKEILFSLMEKKRIILRYQLSSRTVMPGPFVSNNSYNCKDGEDEMVILASCMDLVVQGSEEVDMLMKGASICSLDSGAKVW
ncbi:hypothetical protein OPV22_023279 [Ensete ventricosum]|uniref:Uncharacterized protein n=1 Tax=Ensete ventricosum TaxID=4639 RepID=A0AAV8QSJ7_ENSVE|nr:hypothetical protein OPV22_023279 [Ensete ventricosum]